MDSSKTLNSWQTSMEIDLSKDKLLNFNANEIKDCITIINDDEIGIFSKILYGETLFFGELNDTSHVSKEMKEYLEENQMKNVIFSSLKKEESVYKKLMNIAKKMFA